MKGDFSRNTFLPNKHYRGVLKQQGRVDVDADWNEQQAINLHRIESETVDVIGGCGAPLHNPGFHLVSSVTGLSAVENALPGNQNAPAAAGSVLISAGRFYVDGILCQNEQILRVSDQPDLPAQSALTPGTYLAYLDVWQRHITALDDPLLREKALGGPDTASRVKTVWQVKLLKVADAPRLIAVMNGGSSASVAAKSAGTASAAVQPSVPVSPTALACDGNFPAWNTLVAPRTGRLNAHTQPAGLEQACLLPPSAGYQRLENQLYRVEIHRDSNGQNPTFVWSRDNGTVVTVITSLSGYEVVVADVGPDDVLGFASGQWVEITDDEIELNGRRGQLLQIDTVDEARRKITLHPPLTPTPPPTVNLNAHPKLRRWDQGGDTAASEGVPVTFAWQSLEDGVQVQFTPGTYQTGDYWLIPARSATGEIEWPPYEIPNQNPVPQAALGIRHHYCRLALLNFNGAKFTVISDCRKIFPPLTELLPVKALHVAKIGWVNDEVVDDTELLKLFGNGLTITFDAPPEIVSITNATMIVKIEAIVDLNQRSACELEFYFDGTIAKTTDANTIRWKIDDASLSRLTTLLGIRHRETPARVRVVLKGSTIWSGKDPAQIFLDGQAFGKPALRSDNKTPRTDFIFVTGATARGSDFESWFYFVSPKKVPIGTDTGGTTTETALTAPPKPTAKRKTAKKTKIA